MTQPSDEVVDAEVVDETAGDDTVEATATTADVIEEAEVVGERARTVPAPAPPAASEREITFPRQHARTQRFTLGEPRTVSVTEGGGRILFLRSGGGEDPVNRLWAVDANTGEERLLADPAELLPADSSADLSPDELAHRERVREAAGGITGYATDDDGSLVAFALAGRLFVCTVGSGECRQLAVDGPVFDRAPTPPANASPTSPVARCAWSSSTGPGT